MRRGVFLTLGGVCRPLVLTAALLMAANYGWGSSGACTSPPSYTLVSSYGFTDKTVGCYATDSTFSNFFETANFYGNVDYVAAGESGYTNGIGAYSTYAQFAGGANGDPWTPSASTPMIDDLSFVVDSANTYGFDSAYPTGVTSTITSVALTSAANIVVAGEISVTELICLGAGTCGANYIQLVNSYPNTSDPEIGTCMIFGTIPGAACSPTAAATANFSTAVTGLSVISSYNIEPFGPGTATLDDFQLTFGEDGVSPEPSTFILIGSALAGLAGIRLRKPSQKTPPVTKRRKRAK